MIPTVCRPIISSLQHCCKVNMWSRFPSIAEQVLSQREKTFSYWLRSCSFTGIKRALYYTAFYLVYHIHSIYFLKHGDCFDIYIYSLCFYLYFDIRKPNLWRMRLPSSVCSNEYLTRDSWSFHPLPHGQSACSSQDSLAVWTSLSAVLHYPLTGILGDCSRPEARNP